MSENNDLSSRIKSAAEECYARQRPYFTRFLTETQQAEISALHFPPDINAVFYGGAGNTEPERQCLGLIPSFYRDEDIYAMFPIKAVTLRFRECDAVSHRDILGALMALGIQRDTLGDIYTDKGAAAVFATDNIADLILSDITKIGKVGVKCSEGQGLSIPARKFEEISCAVPSLRLDNIVKCAAHCGRSAAVEKYINPQLVQVNSLICDKASKEIKEGDAISIRGKGKFILAQVMQTGRKGNLHIRLKKYL